MADSERRSTHSDADFLQDMELQGVPGSLEEPVSNEGGVRSLSLTALRFHNLHLSTGRGASTLCAICERGLEGTMAEIEEVRPPRRKPEVAEGSGVDEETPAPSTRSDGPDQEENSVLWP